MTPPRLSECRACGWPSLTSVLHLGTLAYCGLFPKPGESVPEGPLELVTCDACGLAQMGHVYPIGDMYGDSYGYRSGLNPTMEAHLKEIATEAWRIAQPRPGETVVDIGANDGTLLKCYPKSVKRVGFDPLTDKYRQYYAVDITRVAGFFDMPLRDVAIVTSIACFYDLPDPVGVAQAIADMLRPGGVWSVEVADLHAMAEHSAFDQIVHEHLEFYTADDIDSIAQRVGLSLRHSDYNATNGGSVRLVYTKGGPHSIDRPREAIDWASFRKRIDKRVNDLRTFLEDAKRAGRVVYGYGASTKGNVLLQMAGVTPKLMPAILDANPDKAGCVTPGTNIPIVFHDKPLSHLRTALDTVVVFPWHFRDFVLEKEREFLGQRGTIVFPLPTLQQITGPIGEAA